MGMPQVLSAGSVSSGEGVDLPKIEAPKSVSPSERAREEAKRLQLEKELAECRSQSLASEKLLKETSKEKVSIEAQSQELTKKLSRVEKELEEEKRRAEKEQKAKEGLASNLKSKEAELKEMEKVRKQEAEPAQGTASSSSTFPASGISYTDPTTGMEFVWVPGGEFQMGDTFGDGESNEKPPTQKTRIAGFWMGKYEVTQGEWVKVMGKNPSNFQKGDRYPVEQVSWDMVQDFITKLNKLGKPQYRLPSEAEWEYAARVGGKKVRFGTGKDTIGPEEANFNASDLLKRAYSRSDHYRHETTPVNNFDPNSLGLYDMSGNVTEWVQDCWHSSYANAPSDGTAWERNCEGSDRVNRGGSWFNDPRNLRAAVRNYYTRDDASSSLGFRLVLPSSASGQ
jgi:formylglycine-generating enzyme required for sulfatase activity